MMLLLRCSAGDALGDAVHVRAFVPATASDEVIPGGTAAAAAAAAAAEVPAPLRGVEAEAGSRFIACGAPLCGDDMDKEMGPAAAVAMSAASADRTRVRRGDIGSITMDTRVLSEDDAELCRVMPKQGEGGGGMYIREMVQTWGSDITHLHTLSPILRWDTRVTVRPERRACASAAACRKAYSDS